ncbi:MAG: hypothetical protein ACYDAQ_02385 [Mycobacteriales bacterium]
MNEPSDADLHDGSTVPTGVSYDAVVSAAAERLLQLLNGHRVLTTG